MALLAGSLLALRRDPRLLNLPPYLSLLCVLVGVVWLFLLPLDEYSRRCYISENALLPGQVHTYFAGSEQDSFDAIKADITTLVPKSDEERSDVLEEIWRTFGLKTARQNYSCSAGGKQFAGQNVYGLIRAPRGDATEAIVLVASFKNQEGDFNVPGVTLAMTLSRYFKRWSLWSKDIIILVTPESRAGPQAWVDAYHDAHDPAKVDSLPLKSGALQGAIVVDFPQHHHFRTMHVTYDGINGQLPNLDLFNTAINIANGQHGMEVALQKKWTHGGSYQERLKVMLRGMMNQGLGHSSGPHSVFMPYHVDAITLRSINSGPEDEMAYGRVVESLFRSLNNIMEHFHQSFFFYLLMQHDRFVSIGTYLPSAMLVAASFSITAIALWIASGRPEKTPALEKQQKEKGEVQVVEHKGEKAVIPKQELQVVERDLFTPSGIVLGLHFLGVVPLYLFNNATLSTFTPLFYTFAVLNLALPFGLAGLINTLIKPTEQQKLLIKCFSLLILGMFLATLATVNFPLALFVGVLASPLSFVGPSPVPKNGQIANPAVLQAIQVASIAGLSLVSPPVVFQIACLVMDAKVEDVLMEAAFGWHVNGLWTQVIVFGVWWPAWLAGAIGVSL